MIVHLDCDFALVNILTQAHDSKRYFSVGHTILKCYLSLSCQCPVLHINAGKELSLALIILATLPQHFIATAKLVHDNEATLECLLA